MSDNKERSFGGKMLDAATGGIGGLVGSVFGLALQKGQDRRQIRQQEKLNRMQIQGNKELADYQRQMQLQMWKDTNYGAQMEQLKQAGLNPGLIYGMGGAGGATIGGGVPGGVSGGSAAGHSGEIGMGIQAGMQAAMMKAQIDLVKAQTQKTEAEVPKTEAETKSLIQGVENAKAQKELTEIQTDLARIDEYIKGRTQNAAIALVLTELREATARMDIMENDQQISAATKDEKIAIVEQQLIEIGLRNELTKAGINKTEAEINKIAIELQLWAQEIAISKGQLSVAERNAAVAEKLAEYNTSLTKEAFNMVGGILGGIVEQRLGGARKINNAIKK